MGRANCENKQWVRCGYDTDWVSCGKCRQCLDAAPTPRPQRPTVRPMAAAVLSLDDTIAEAEPQGLTGAAVVMGARFARRLTVRLHGEPTQAERDEWAKMTPEEKRAATDPKRAMEGR